MQREPVPPGLVGGKRLAAPFPIHPGQSRDIDRSIVDGEAASRSKERLAVVIRCLPALGFAEKAGSFTNFQGRIQKIHRALTPHLASRSLPEVLRDLARDLGRSLGEIEPERVWAAIGEKAGVYQGIAWKDIEPLGLLAEPRVERSVS